ncbi:GNAT family N-acetyltransferase [Bailinhaonella thermotolerans]|uniref:N-acetyltransferase n=1 Tax=Bailinhaonella thermotolerans TaxID=1070861 RepID=A0A3A4A8B8_9ACTN|nr:GNAT family N-acetyltransferase [Bailinhaonella thermotolerans]RJL24219.1 N-acetyltransferase [Bailinhaonella thermotolerans]
MRIRPATLADLKTVGAIYAHYVREGVATFDEEPPGPEAWEAKHADLAARGLPFLVAEVDGEVAGYAYAAQYRPKPAYRHTVEDTIYLAPERTGRGLGKALLTALIEDATRAGARQMIAVVADTGDPASTLLHLRHGFTEVGRLKAVGRKHGRWVDTVLLQRELAAED